MVETKLGLSVKGKGEDPEAHDLDTSDSDDHFSDAQSGPEQSDGASPVIPVTRVEKVDDEPSHGEVPGTHAYNVREAEALPNDVVMISEAKSLSEKGGLHSLSAATAEDTAHDETDGMAGCFPVPVTKVEKFDSEPSHGAVPSTKASELRKEDAGSDIIERIEDAPGEDKYFPVISERVTGSGSPTGDRSSNIYHTRRRSSGVIKVSGPIDYDEEEDGDFGDDFDDFEEGEDDAEFDDFDDGFQEPEPAPHSQPTAAMPLFTVLDFADLDSGDDVQDATEPYMNVLFPPDTIDTSVLPSVSAENPIFLTQRSASLWAQLVAPPPLQPPNWIRSRIRRLFLVSLGVPVDLDEILPASKQKKLILPSIHLNPSSTSPRESTDSRSISRLKQGDGNGSTTSVDSQGKTRSDSKRRKGPAPAPYLDLVSARQQCAITDEALNGLTLEELKTHIQKLEAMQSTANEVLEYWTSRTDEKLGDREAFEGVIENLVKHARKVRK